MSFVEKSTQIQSNGTNAVSVVPAPASGVRRLIRTITANNTNATTRTVTLRYASAATGSPFNFVVQALAQNETYVWNDLLVLDATANSIEAVLDGGTTDVEFTSHYADAT